MQICMQFSSGISSLVSGRLVHVPNKAPINNTNNNIIFPTVVFTLQLPHSTSSLQHLRGVCWGVTRSRADDLKRSAGVCKVQLFVRSQCSVMG